MTIRTSQRAMSVTQLTMAIKNLLEPRFNLVEVQGEISNCTAHSSGHLYFSLKDKNAQISAALFKGNAQRLPRLPKSGDQVTVTGHISVYAPRGNYQLIVKDVKFSGVGDLLLKLHQTKEKLEKMGWFDPAIKKKLPQLPKRIGVVTSPTGAVIRDIINVLTRRFPNIQLILNPVKVQGVGAAEEIALAINDFNTHNLADILIVGRGGGSLEDLWAFNEECVAKAIHESKIPVISAVGHETDFSIADFVADVRAPTPSAAAEIAIAEKAQLQLSLTSFRNQMIKGMVHRLEKHKTQLDSFSKQNYFSSPYALLGKYYQRLDDSRDTLDLKIFHKLSQYRSMISGYQKQIEAYQPTRQIEFFKERISEFQKKLDRNWLVYISQRKEKLLQTVKHLKSLDPKNLLKKGYSILFSENTGSLIISTEEIKTDDTIIAHLSNGKIKATINQVYPNHE